jgi:GGDEF domain-containing protein
VLAPSRRAWTGAGSRGGSTQPKRRTAPGPQPQTRSELLVWVREHGLPTYLEAGLLGAIETVFTRHEKLWQESKQEAIHALSTGFGDKMAHVRTELCAKDATISSISRYFETLVADLTDQSHRDPKTRLVNFNHFSEQLESFLALEQRGRWCAIGLVDIKSFKRYNDTLGHAVGDRIIERVAHLLREQVRSDDVLARDQLDSRTNELHARFGGDEFCFMIRDLAEYGQAFAIGERFRKAVEEYDWSREDSRLVAQPVRVDVGIVCLWLGPMAERHGVARRLSSDLMQRADQLMYDAKDERESRIHLVVTRIEQGELVEMPDVEQQAANASTRSVDDRVITEPTSGLLETRARLSDAPRAGERRARVSHDQPLTAASSSHLHLRPAAEGREHRGPRRCT